MAGQDKTEEPTAKRLQEARKRGQIPVSKELGLALGLVGLFGMLSFAANYLLQGYSEIMRAGLRLTAYPSGDPIFLMSKVAALALKAAPLIIIPAAAVGILGLAAGALQTKFNFSPEALKPSFKKLDPIQGLKRLVGYKGLFEVIKELIKVTVVGAAAYLVLWPQKEALAQLVGAQPWTILAYLGGLVLKLGFATAGAYLLLAIIDVMFQRFSTGRDLRMTREEVKQEARQTDLAPELKGLIRQRQMETSRKRMMADVPEADVVITNPTHFAVALAYSDGDPAPKVVATGADLIALQIRARAAECGIEIIENPPLARALHANCELGEWVPESLYAAVAEILALVYRKRQRSGFSATV